MKRRYLIYFIAVCIFIFAGCDIKNLSERFAETEDTSEYDYRSMYLNNDSGDLTDKDLEAFNEASRIYSLYMEDCSSDYEKVLAAHDYIVKCCTYNKSAIDNNTLSDDDFHPYGVFVKEKAVCEGYARAFKLLMDIAGIECIMVTGTVGEENTSHAWNMVKLDDRWYHIDVTFDDPYPETKEVVYLYFNVTDEILRKDHTWNINTTPEAESDKFDYIKNNYTIYRSESDIKNIIAESNTDRATYVSYIWSGDEMISEDVWKEAIKDTDITNLSYSCIGVSGRRMYMVNFIY